MPSLKATDLLSHFRVLGAWVNWSDTVDQFLHGDPEREVRKVARAWIATNRVIWEAAS